MGDRTDPRSHPHLRGKPVPAKGETDQDDKSEHGKPDTTRRHIQHAVHLLGEPREGVLATALSEGPDAVAQQAKQGGAHLAKACQHLAWSRDQHTAQISDLWQKRDDQKKHLDWMAGKIQEEKDAREKQGKVLLALTIPVAFGIATLIGYVAFTALKLLYGWLV